MTGTMMAIVMGEDVIGHGRDEMCGETSRWSRRVPVTGLRDEGRRPSENVHVNGLEKEKEIENQRLTRVEVKVEKDGAGSSGIRYLT